MSWIKLSLNPVSEWNEAIIPDWIEALRAYEDIRGKALNPSLQTIPGYKILALGDDNAGEVLLSSVERVVILMDINVVDSDMRELVGVIIRFAREMGAITLKAPINFSAERLFWKRLGAETVPEIVPLSENIRRDRISVEPLFKHSILVKYRNEPALCLEPIFCTVRPPGPISLAERRLSKILGNGRPIGFASRISAFSPWEIKKEQWDDLLAYSRLHAYEVLEELVLKSLPRDQYVLV